MDQIRTEVPEQAVGASGERTIATTMAASAADPPERVVAPQVCANCGATPSAEGGAAVAPSYIYVLGAIKAVFPRPSVEKEFAQATGRAETKGLTDRQAVHKVLSQRQNRYLARQLCWVLSVEGLETYILIPRDPADLDLLIDSLRPTPSPMDLDCVIGIRGPIAPPDMCNGLMLPIVMFDQIYSFDRDSLIEAIPGPEKASAKAKDFTHAAEQLFDRVMQMADNAGATDQDRALNYLAVRYQAIYISVADAFARNASLTGVDVQPSGLSSTRNVVDVVFTYTNRNTDVDEKFFVRVDVTDEFPFLVTKLSPYYSR